MTYASYDIQTYDPPDWWIEQKLKPRVRELVQMGDAKRFRILYRGVTKIFTLSGCQLTANPASTPKEIEFQIKRLMTYIERETA